jgi:hypothetical protein
MPDQNSTQDFIRLTYYHLALLAGGFTVIGALLGAWLNHYFSNWRNRKERFLNAYDTFRQAFLPAIHDLEQNCAISAARIILSEHSKQSYALKVFYPYIDESHTLAVKTKWEEYQKYHDAYYNAFCDTLDRQDALGIIDFVCKNRTDDDKLNRGKILNLLNDILRVTKHG